MNGLLIIDKPQGMTSHDVVRRIRRLFRTRKVGHAGTLDPLATGVLPVALGEATRTLQFLMAGAKTYRATLKLGEVTDTQDAEGQVLETHPVPTLTAEEIDGVCRSFLGTIEQLPPMYSALKKDGVPLHRLARQGVEVERETREVHIERLDVLEIDLPFVTLEVDCSKGTYVRTLAHDIGQRLGPGAHLTALRRRRNGAFSEADSVTLSALEACPDPRQHPGLLSLESALRAYPALEIDAAAAQRLGHGIPPELGALSDPVTVAAGEVVMLHHAGHLMAAARFAPGREQEKRGDFELLRVFNRI